MEREWLLSVIIALLAGTTILACGWWPARHGGRNSARRIESLMWREIWLPLVPALLIAAYLCGWAMVEPDPVPEKVPPAVLIASVPLLLLFARAGARAGWSLFRDNGDPMAATVGLLRPWILFSPRLAKALDDREIDAALEHERAHARHRDPLRIWLAQLATDLQWPWPQAAERFRRWTVTLELARDEEARVAGVDGADLAAAILAAARLRRSTACASAAALISERSALKERVSYLLDALADEKPRKTAGRNAAVGLLAASTLVALVLGSFFGETLIHTLLRIAA